MLKALQKSYKTPPKDQKPHRIIPDIYPNKTPNKEHLNLGDEPAATPSEVDGNLTEVSVWRTNRETCQETPEPLEEGK